MSMTGSSVSSPSQQEALPDQTLQAPLYVSVIDLCNTILGTGLVSLPYVFGIFGLGAGSILLALSCLSTLYSLHLLVECGELAYANDIPQNSLFLKPGELSYSTVCDACLVQPWIAESVFAVSCFGFATSYLVNIGSVFPLIFTSILPLGTPTLIVQILTHRFCCMILFLTMIWPLSLSKRVDEFWWFSGTCLGCALYLAMLVLFNSLCAIYQAPTPASIPAFQFPLKGLEALGIFVFAFTCHQNVFIANQIFSIYDDLGASYKGDQLPKHQLTRIRTVVNISVLGVGCLYLLIGTVGYFGYGPESSVIALDNYPDNVWTLFGRLCYALLAAMSFPIQAHPCRQGLDSVLSHFGYFGEYQSLNHELVEPDRRKYLTALIVFGSYVAAFLVPDVDTILSVVGATGGVYICFMLPSILYFRLATGKTYVYRVFATIVCGLGSVVMALELFYFVFTK